MSCQFEFTFIRFMPFDSVPKMSAPRTVPIIVARPPEQADVPPMTTAVMTWSSRMRPALPGVTPLVRAAATMPASATSRPGDRRRCDRGGDDGDAREARGLGVAADGEG